jgi:two-component system, NtrC family, response regulator HydG
VPLPLPPLRDRVDDLAALSTSLLARLAPARRLALAPAALARLQAHPFPGNVRELRNVLERAVLFSDGPVVHAHAVEQALALGAAVLRPRVAGLALAAHPAPPGCAAASPLVLAERAALRAALAEHGGDRHALARALGLSLRTLYRRLQALREADQAAVRTRTL